MSEGFSTESELAVPSCFNAPSSVCQPKIHKKIHKYIHKQPTLLTTPPQHAVPLHSAAGAAAGAAAAAAAAGEHSLLALCVQRWWAYKTHTYAPHNLAISPLVKQLRSDGKKGPAAAAATAAAASSSSNTCPSTAAARCSSRRCWWPAALRPTSQPGAWCRGRIIVKHRCCFACRP